MVNEENLSNEKGFGYEIFIALISILSIANLALAIIPGLNRNIYDVVETINLFLTIIFILDFVYRMVTARSKSQYFVHDFGWADLLACSPLFRFLRIFRIFKAYRLLKKHGTKEIIDYLTHHRAESALYILVFCVILILEVGSFLVLSAESKSPDANIKSASDALWWSYVTITTVGYGDRYPVTNAGRLVGIIVMTTGVGIFATFAGFISNKLLTSPEKEENEPEVTVPLPTHTPFEEDLLARIDRIEAFIAQQERKSNEIGVKIDRIERTLAEQKTGISQPVIILDGNTPGKGGPVEKEPDSPDSKEDYRSSFWKNARKKQ